MKRHSRGVRANTVARHSLFRLLAICLTSVCSHAAAALTLTLSPTTQQGSQGDLLTYGVTLQNDLTGTVFLNGDSVDLFAPDVTADDTPFLFNAPATLGPGATWSGNAFTLTIGPTTPFQSYTGSFDVFGGSDANASGVLASAPFELVVSPVPEPSGAVLVLSVLVCFALLQRIFKRNPLASSRVGTVLRRVPWFRLQRGEVSRFE